MNAECRKLMNCDLLYVGLLKILPALSVQDSFNKDNYETNTFTILVFGTRKEFDRYVCFRTGKNSEGR